MDVIAEAPNLLGSLFEDGGAALLGQGGLGTDWRAALAHVPPAVLAIAPGPDAGLRQLLRLRDFWSSRNDLRPAVAATRGLVDVLARRVGPHHPDTLVELATLGVLADRAGRVDEGARLIEEALERLRPQVSGRDLRLAVVSGHAGRSRMSRGDVKGAEAALDVAWRIRTDVAPDTAALVAAQLGEVRLKLGDVQGALPLLKDAWEATRAREGDESPRALARAQMLGSVYNQLGRHDAAVKALRPVHAHLGDAPPERRAAVAFELGLALARTGVAEEGLRLVDESVRWTRAWGQRSGSPHPSLPGRLTMFAQLQNQRGRPGEAEGMLMEALDAERQLYGDASPQVAQRYASIGRLVGGQGRLDEAIGWLDPACSLLRSALGDADPRVVEAVEAQAGFVLQRATQALASRDRELAGGLVLRAYDLAAAVLGHGHERTRRLRDLRDSHRLRG